MVAPRGIGHGRVLKHPLQAEARSTLLERKVGLDLLQH